MNEHSPEISLLAPGFAYYGDNCAILSDCTLAASDAAFSAHAFLFPETRLPDLIIDGMKFPLQPDTVFALPAGKAHRWTFGMSRAGLSILFVEPTFMRSVESEANTDAFFLNPASIPIDFEMKQLTRYFRQETRDVRIGNKVVLHSLESLILVHLIRVYQHESSRKFAQRKYLTRMNIQKAIEYMHSSFNQDLTLREIADIANLSPYYFIRVFKEEMGKTPFEYLMDIKLSAGMELLRKGEIPLGEVCYSAGFVNQSHFSRLFKKKYGCSPKEIRKIRDRRN